MKTMKEFMNEIFENYGADAEYEMAMKFMTAINDDNDEHLDSLLNKYDIDTKTETGMEAWEQFVWDWEE